MNPEERSLAVKEIYPAILEGMRENKHPYDIAIDAVMLFERSYDSTRRGVKADPDRAERDEPWIIINQPRPAKKEKK